MVLQWKLYEWEALTARLMIASGLSFRCFMLSVGSCVVVSRPDDCMSAKMGLQCSEKQQTWPNITPMSAPTSNDMMSDSDVVFFSSCSAAHLAA